MDSTEPTTSTPRAQVSALVADLIMGSSPLKVALDLWKSHHGLTYEGVSILLDRKKGSVSAWTKRPEKLQPLGRDISDLIGYEQRPGGAA